MIYGTVTRFDPETGVGVITVDGTGVEVPVRASDIDGGGRQSLRVNARVAFSVQEGPSGPQAVDVFVP